VVVAHHGCMQCSRLCGRGRVWCALSVAVVSAAADVAAVSRTAAGCGVVLYHMFDVLRLLACLQAVLLLFVTHWSRFSA
jgi:hypothetical protein